MKLKQKTGTGSMTTAKNEDLNWLLIKNCYSMRAMNLWWCWCMGWSTRGILASEGDFPPSPK